MIVYIDKKKTYCINENKMTVTDLGIVLFDYLNDYKEDRDLQEVIEAVFFKEGSPTRNYMEYSRNSESRYKLQNYNYDTFIYSDEKKLHFAYNVADIQDVIFIELAHIINNNSKINQCKRCGKLFVAKNNHNTNYCDRVDMVLGVSCSKVGSAEAYKDKLTKNPILQEYQKAYKRLYARVRSGRMEQAEFDDWVRNITIERDSLAERYSQSQDISIVESFMLLVGNKKK